MSATVLCIPPRTDLETQCSRGLYRLVDVRDIVDALGLKYNASTHDRMKAKLEIKVAKDGILDLI